MAKKDLFRSWMVKTYLESGAYPAPHEVQGLVLGASPLCAVRYAVRRKTALFLFRILFPPFS
jgi:hypothetical protein